MSKAWKIPSSTLHSGATHSLLSLLPPFGPTISSKTLGRVMTRIDNVQCLHHGKTGMKINQKLLVRCSHSVYQAFNGSFKNKLLTMKKKISVLTSTSVLVKKIYSEYCCYCIIAAILKKCERIIYITMVVDCCFLKTFINIFTYLPTYKLIKHIMNLDRDFTLD